MLQVRSKGPVDKVSHQPVKGRKRGGGVRFGEMERDGVLAHGASWVLLDRLFNSSDKSRVSISITSFLVFSLTFKHKRRLSLFETGLLPFSQRFTKDTTIIYLAQPE